MSDIAGAAGVDTGITMCHSEGCPLKKTCYRSEGIQSVWQSFFVELPFDFEDEVCKFYWRMEGL